MYSPTVRHPPASAIASTRCRCSSPRAAKRLPMSCSGVHRKVLPIGEAEVASASVIHHFEAWKQGVVEPELRQVADAARVQDAVHVVYFMLDDPGVKTSHASVDWAAGGVHAGIADFTVSGHQPTHSRNRQAALPTVLQVGAEGRQDGVNEDGVGHGIDVRIARIGVHTKDDYAQADANLRRSKACPIEIPHGVPHVDKQGCQLWRTEFAYRFTMRDLNG